MPKATSYFLDTNILVYCFDVANQVKQQQAKSILSENHNWHINWQVIQEFCNVSLHRFKTPLTITYLDSLLEHLLYPHCTVYPTREIYQNALQIHQSTQYRFYDALIIASAIESGANTLLTEDLQDGRTIAGLNIKNPFKRESSS